MHTKVMQKVLHKSYVEMQIEDILPNEVYEIYVKPDFNTASWRYHEGVHKIIIGEDIFVSLESDASDKLKYQCLHSYFYHELAHSIWTYRDLGAISKLLKHEKIPFILFNLFEDARIEEKMRHYLKRLFKWKKFEELTLPKNPLEMLFYIIQCEHSKSDMALIRKEEAFNKVFDFYKKTVKCVDSFDVIELLKEWIAFFPLTKNEIEEMRYVEYLFVNEARYEGAKEFEELLVDTILVLESEGDTKESKRGRSKLKTKQSTKSNLLTQEPTDLCFNIQERDKLLREMQKLFVDTKRNIATEAPSKRLNVKRLASGSKKIFRKKVLEKRVKKKVNIILDLSGSMQETMPNMHLIIDVMDSMSRANYIDATLILTAEKNGYGAYEILEMPLQKGTIAKLQALNCAEGLDNTMRCNMQLLQRADYNWILTDGYIDEKPLDKKYFANKGIRTHAMYIGDIAVKQEMQLSFDYVLCEPDVMALTKKIFMMIIL